MLVWKITVPLEHLYVHINDSEGSVPGQYLDEGVYQTFSNRNSKNAFESTVYVKKDFFESVISELEYSGILAEVWFKTIESGETTAVGTAVIVDDSATQELFDSIQTKGAQYNTTIESVDPATYFS